MSSLPSPANGSRKLPDAAESCDVPAKASPDDKSPNAAWRPSPPDYARIDSWYREVRDQLASIAAPGKLAARRDLDPGWFRGNLRLVNLVDVLRDAGGAVRFRFRLVGTTQTEIARREITGLFVEDAVLPPYVDRIVANMRAVVSTKGPIYDRFPMPHPDREFIDSERVYFPLASDGETVDMILVACNYPSELRLRPGSGEPP